MLGPVEGGKAVGYVFVELEYKAAFVVGSDG